jgi:hypothetical protein
MTEIAGRIPLADMIDALRAELYQAVSRSDGQGIRFGIDKLDVELSVQVSKGGSGKVGIRFWVVSAEASGNVIATDIHKVHISLLPIDEGGKPLIISETTSTRPR